MDQINGHDFHGGTYSLAYRNEHVGKPLLISGALANTESNDVALNSAISMVNSTSEKFETSSTNAPNDTPTPVGANNIR